MNRYNETFETWNKVALIYQEKFMDLELYDETYDVFCNSITNDNAKLLEIGCGPGNITKHILSLKKNFNIFGIDISPNMIELAKINNPSANFATMDCRQISHSKEKYHGIICGFCLPYLSFSDSEILFSDCADLLNEDGILYLSFVEGDPKKSSLLVGSTGDRTYFYYYNLDFVMNQLSFNNFEIVRIFNVEFEKVENEIEFHTIVIAKKMNA